MGDASYIHVIPIEGGTAQQLTFSGSANGPAWSPDGKEIAFVSFTNGVQRIATVSASGGTPRVFDKTRPSVPNSSSWAPGARIVYQAEDGRLRILDPVTEEEMAFPTEDVEVTVGMARLSPDGNHIAVKVWLDSGRGRILVAELQSGGSRVVSEHEQDWAPIAWSGDGNGIYALREIEGYAAIIRIPAEGGEATLVARLPFRWEELKWATVTSDGRGIVCEVAREQSDIWLMENFDPEIR
jgi:TolB protein